MHDYPDWHDDWSEYMRQALMAQFMALPVPMKPDNERIPGRDGMEDGDE